MKKKAVEESKHAAIYTVHFATGPKNCCEKHARGLVAIGEILGVYVPVTNLDTPATCISCKIEAASKD